MNVTQEVAQSLFLENVEKYFKAIIYNKEKQEYIKSIILKIDHMSPEEISLTFNDLNIEGIRLLSNEYKKYITKKLATSSISETDKKKYIKTLDESNLLHFADIKQSQLYETGNPKEELKNLLLDIKGYLRMLTVTELAGEKILNLTSLKNALNITNVTRLKSNIRAATNLFLNFNYINRKHIKIETRSSYVSSVSFITEGNDVWIKYQIPDEILNLLVAPTYYANIIPYEVFQMKGKYTIRLYCLLKDYFYAKEISITREEMQNFLQVPKSALKVKAHFVDKIIEPSLAEIYSITGMKISYTLTPDTRNFERITFKITSAPEVQYTKANVKLKEDNPTFYDSETILKNIELMRGNTIVNKLWNKRAINKIQKTYIEMGEEFTIALLQKVTQSEEIKEKTLVQHMNKIIKELENMQVHKKVSRTLKIQKIIKEQKEEKLKAKQKEEIKLDGELALYCVKNNRKIVDGKFIVTPEECEYEYNRRCKILEEQYGRKLTEDEQLALSIEIMEYFIME